MPVPVRTAHLGPRPLLEDGGTSIIIIREMPPNPNTPVIASYQTYRGHYFTVLRPKAAIYEPRPTPLQLNLTSILTFPPSVELSPTTSSYISSAPCLSTTVASCLTSFLISNRHFILRQTPADLATDGTRLSSATLPPTHLVHSSQQDCQHLLAPIPRILECLHT